MPHPIEQRISAFLDRGRKGPASVPSHTVTEDANMGIRFADPISSFPATDASVPGRLQRATSDILRVGVSQHSPAVRTGYSSPIGGQGNYAGSDVAAPKGISVGEPLTTFENPGIFSTGKGFGGKIVGRAGELTAVARTRISALRSRLGFPR